MIAAPDVIASAKHITPYTKPLDSIIINMPSNLNPSMYNYTDDFLRVSAKIPVSSPIIFATKERLVTCIAEPPVPINAATAYISYLPVSGWLQPSHVHTHPP